ncbi:MAG: BtpA/SgcQ family protein [Clostridiales bacterium]|nr:BtpA/SgcQ family protein [Clostridiales bacterium]
MDLIERVQHGGKGLIGMVHCLPLPGTFRADTTIRQVVDRAVSDAKALQDAGFDALIVENEDKCTAPKLTMAQITALSIVVMAVRDAVRLPIGLSCGSLNYEFAFSLAKIADCQFVRVPVFVDTVMNHTGIVTPCSQQVVHCRKMVGAEDIKIFADVQVKHYYMLNPNIPITASADWAVNQGADAIIVTGASTGMETPLDDLRQVKKRVPIPVVAGSGVTETNIKEQLGAADLLIVGSSLRKDGCFGNPIDAQRAAKLVCAAGLAEAQPCETFVKKGAAI